MCARLSWLLVIASLTQAWAGGVFWTDRGASQLKRMNFDGSALQSITLSGTVSAPGSNLRGIAVDTMHNRLFWADNGSDTILRANLDGTDSRAIVSITGGNSFPADVRPDLTNGLLYWCDQTRNYLQHATFDGASVTDVITNAAATGPYFLDLDPAAGKLYWGDFSGGAIFRANLDGSGRETLLTGNNQTRGVCVDPAGGRLYWVNRDDKRIHRCPLSAFDHGAITLQHPSVETLYTGLDTPHGLVLDVPAGKLYWADTGSNSGQGFGERSVCRGDLDGKTAAEIIASGSEPWDVDLDRRCTTYAEWRGRFFRKDTPLNQVGPASDPDGDGLVNAMEYLLGLPPLSPNLTDRPTGLLVAGPEAGAQYPAIRFQRNALATDLSLRLQVSTNLKAWDDNAAGSTVEVSVVKLADGIEEVTVRTATPLSDTKPCYLRFVLAL